jgi:hypothetical protein
MHTHANMSRMSRLSISIWLAGESGGLRLVLSIPDGLLRLRWRPICGPARVCAEIGDALV